MAVHRQEVKNPPFKPLEGILFILGLVISLYLLGVILGTCQRVFGMSYGTASSLVWVIGAAEVIALMQLRVLSFQYTLDGSNLKLDRLYGKYMRPARTIMFRRIEDFGPAEEMLKKHPDARKEFFVRRKCEIPQMAIVHVANNKRYITVIQPDEAICAALKNR